MARIIESSGSIGARVGVVDSNKTFVGVNPALLRLLQSSSVLLLQGPVGPFFDRLASWLQGHDIRVARVAFQAGDLRDSRVLKPVLFQGDSQAWPEFFDQLVSRLNIDCVVLFGQVRSYHRAALARAKAKGLSVVVLEEGYIRPGYLTMELDGVNGYSTTLQQYVWHASAPGSAIRLDKPANTDGQFGLMARSAMAHYWAMNAGKKHFPHYQHHKSTCISDYCRYWVKSWLKKQLHRWQDERRVSWLADRTTYLVPLQHDGDSQITHHSRFEENTKFIFEVMRSFSDHAPKGTLLVFKQHPFSRGGPGHSGFIRSLALELGIGHRVLHMVEGHTPTLVKNAAAVIVINSTVGLQALLHRRPLIVLGEAIYSGPGLTFQGELKDFWKDHHEPEESAVKHLVNQIIHLTQVPCNVYGPANEPLLWHVDGVPNAEGLA